jgi:magnesium-transporting ATPase (P-type)
VLHCSGTEVSGEQTAALQALLEGSLLCNDSALGKDAATGHWLPNGAPTEVSLITAAMKAGLQPETVKAAKPRVASVPFESEHKVGQLSSLQLSRQFLSAHACGAYTSF